MSSNHLILCHPLFLLPSIFPSFRSFLMSQFFISGGQSIGVSASPISPSNEYSRLISFRMEWLDLLAQSYLCYRVGPSWLSNYSSVCMSIELDSLWSIWSVWLVFCECVFHPVCPLVRIRIRGLWKLLDGRDWLWGKWGWGHDQFSSVTQSCLTLCDPMGCSTPGLPVHRQYRVYSNSCPLSRWCHPTISSSVVPFSSCPQSFSASDLF